MNKKKFLIIVTIGLLLLAPVLGALPASANADTKPETIVFITEPDFENAITMLEDGNLDIYPAHITDSGLLERVEASPDLDYYKTYGSYLELTFNPAGPVFSNGKLNPFAVPRVREAMNYLIDREHITDVIMGGLGMPRWTTLNTVSLDAASLASELRAIELDYAYNLQLAKQIIDGRMQSLGAVLIGGIWHYNGEPVEIIVLIRIEDERMAIGDYVADQLEAIGFQVVRDYKAAAEAVYWYSGDPNDGSFHIFTGGWIATSIERDLAGNFAFFYTDMGFPYPLWQAYVNTPEFYDLARRLDEADFATFTERRTMMANALRLSMQDSVRIFLSEVNSFVPKQTNINLASDLYGGVARSMLWAKSIQCSPCPEEVIVAVPTRFEDPWNPIAGSNWYYDMIPIRGTADFGLVTDPFTGLMLPDRIESAEVVIAQGNPVQKTLDWVELDFVPEIVVPQDAWADWDAETQMFKTVAELGLGTVTAQRKSTVYYPEDLYETVKWHDDSPFSIADILMGVILTFDRGNPESDIYDQSAGASLSAFMSSFKGLKIYELNNQLVIETYSDAFQRDAEASVTTWWPYYAQGQGAWHTLNLGIRAEAAGEGAFSRSKAFDIGAPWLDFTTEAGGVLTDQLANWDLDGLIPYAPTLNAYIDQAELEGRIANLQDWYGEHGHFWIGTGPYTLASLDRNQDIVTMVQFADHPDPADRWIDFVGSPNPNIFLSGPDSIDLGGEAVFDIFITQDPAPSPGLSRLQGFELRSGQPYPSSDIDRVEFLLAGRNKVVLSGQADFVEEGHYQVVVDRVTASSLPGGAIQLDLVVVSKRVVMSSTSSLGIDNQNFTVFLPLTLR